MMPVQISTRHKMVGVPYRQDVRNLFPNALQVGRMLALPHDLTSTVMLRNIGFDVPAPINLYYDYCGGTPFDVQRKTCAMLTTNPRGYVLNGMGTGKTRCGIWAFDYLKRIAMANKLLVCAPLSTLNFTWAREVLGTCSHLRVSVLHGTKAKRLQRLAEDADIYVINHDGLRVLEQEILSREDIDTFIIDELATFRNPTAETTKVARRLAAKMRWAWGFTGSPMPNEPTDVWAQATILTPATVNKRFTRFREELMQKVSTFRWVAKREAIDKAYAALQPAVRYTLDDILELPELIERTVDIDLGPKQERVYKAMELHASAMVQSEQITAVNAGAVLNKLIQIALGYVYDRDHNVHPLDNDNRRQALLDAVNSTDRKVLVFVPYKHALNGIMETLTSQGIDCAQISGDTPQKERDRIFYLFQQTERVKVIAAHPETMAHGLTLTNASTIVWFGPTTSLEIYEQANARIRRYGQKHKQQVIHFASTAVERKIYKRLQSKQKTQNILLEMFRENSE